MSSTISSASAASIQNLTRSIMQNFDSNQDGQFSVDEFGAFLTAFMKSVAGTASTTGANGGGVGTTAFLSALKSSSAATASTALPPCPPGWDNAKWANASHTSIKYVAGRIMARYSPGDWVNPASREQILADFKAAGLNPTASGKDRCDFGDGAGPIDIVQGASDGGRAWQWLPVNEG